MKHLLCIIILTICCTQAKAQCAHLEYNEILALEKKDLDVTFKWYLSETLDLFYKSIKDPSLMRDFKQCQDEMVRLYRIYDTLHPGEADLVMR